MGQIQMSVRNMKVVDHLVPQHKHGIRDGSLDCILRHVVLENMEDCLFSAFGPALRQDLCASGDQQGCLFEETWRRRGMRPIHASTARPASEWRIKGGGFRGATGGAGRAVLGLPTVASIAVIGILLHGRASTHLPRRHR